MDPTSLDEVITLTLTYAKGVSTTYPKVCPFLLIHGGRRGVPINHKSLGRPYQIHLKLPQYLLNNHYVIRLIQEHHIRVHPLSPTPKLRITLL